MSSFFSDFENEMLVDLVDCLGHMQTSTYCPSPQTYSLGRSFFHVFLSVTWKLHQLLLSSPVALVTLYPSLLHFFQIAWIITLICMYVCTLQTNLILSILGMHGCKIILLMPTKILVLCWSSNYPALKLKLSGTRSWNSLSSFIQTARKSNLGEKLCK